MGEMIPCLSLWEPWASLWMRGPKVHETRHWPAPEKLVGRRIVVHAAKKRIKPEDLEPDLRELLSSVPGMPLQYGMALGTGVLARCARTEDTEPASDADRVAGNWASGRYAWRMEDRITFPEPIPLRGRQGIFYVPTEDLGL